MEDASQIPAMREPLLLELGATVHMQPVMTPEDLWGWPGRHCSKGGKSTAREHFTHHLESVGSHINTGLGPKGAGLS